MNFKKRVNGSWDDTPHYIHNTSTDTITTLPAVLYPTGTTATVGLKGNTVQTGTPTPDNPIMPQGTGERTGNLVDRTTCTENKLLVWASGELYNEDGSIATDFIQVKSGDKFVSNYNSQKMFYNKNKVYLGALLNSGTLGINVTDNINIGAYFTVPNVEDIAYVRLGYRKPYNAGSDMLTANIMLNLGSEALPYEPYGYKIPISSASTTTPVYLGEVETTRKVKKLVLDGTENWVLEYTDNFLLNTAIDDAQPLQLVVCTHQQSISINYETNTNFENVRISQTKKLNFRTRIIPHNLSDFKSYLAQQYAAGTPVTVWYVLANETTGIVNEPLMKIGEYADSISGITIPTIAGANTISVDTTLQPSEVTVNYKGWHPVADVHERENGAWT